MEIRNRLYPYPVLSAGTDDFNENSYFSLDLDVIKDGHEVKFVFKPSLKETVLEKMIKNQQVGYVYHIECSQTGFRIVTNNNISINESRLSGRVQVCGFIVAKVDIVAYSSPNFHADLLGYSFAIEEGNILGIGGSFNIDLTPKLDDLVKVPSIFSIIQNMDGAINYMQVDIDSDKIKIKLPFDSFIHYGNLNNTMSVRDILNAAVLVPALTYVLSEIKMEVPENRNESFGEHRWYIALKKTLSGRDFNVDIESNDFLEAETAIHLAQKLLDNPIKGALDFLAVGINSEDGE